MKTHIYLEGGGDSKELRSRCRKGFKKLFEKMDLPRLPSTSACGGRATAFDQFQTAFSAKKDQNSLLLVDSEDPIDGLSEKADAPSAGAHLKKRDGWKKPAKAKNEQVLLMANCMETWISADRDALEKHYGKANLNPKSLPPLENIESRNRHEIQSGLIKATEKSGHRYKKGDLSFKILAELEPAALRKNLTQFRRLEVVLKKTT